MKRYFLFLAAVLILPVGAKACPVSVTITATNEAGQSQVATLGGETSLDASTGNFVWTLGSEYTFKDDAAIESLTLTSNGDPEVGIEFGVRAGSSTTTFSILSDVISFDPLVNPTAYASAGVTLTDRTPTPGATITGLFDGKTHQARYNGSIVFANLVDGFSIGSGTLTASEDKPLSGSQVISGTLTSIESEFSFKLSARDSASGTSTFEIIPAVVPEPATVGLLGLGTLSLLRRKRRA
ncbi:MAG: PEP-CTERM sorting domain-containing protein [Sedimentisphaerales bacterium]|jgi:hypothetical protein